MKTTDLHIVLGCTNRKRAVTTGYPRLREIVADDVERRAVAWIARVADAPPTVAARDLYAGEYWRAGLDLAAKAARDFSTSTWVLSAGLGLIKVGDRVPAYGATLASGHEDSVVTGTDQRSAREVRRRWWSALASWQGPVGVRGPRRMSDLAADGSTIIICAGPDYLSAIAPELLDALNVLGGQRLLVFGSGLHEPGLESAWVRVPGQLRLRFGGSMSSTGVRVASAIIHDAAESGVVDGDHARQLVASWSAATLPLPRFERKRLSDRDIELWIRSDLEAHPDSVNKSISLRRFRDDGFACEQSRFGRLHGRISGVHP